MSLAQRSLRSSTYTISASAIQTVVQFIRSVFLARILAPEIFGIYAYASAIILMTHTLPIFGMTSGLLHRAEESEGEIALRVHFTLSLITNSIWGVLIFIIGYIFISPEKRWVLYAILITQIIDNLVQTSKTLLIKRVVFRRIALIDTLNIILGAVIAILLARAGAGVWSLVSTDITAASLGIIGYVLYKPPWRIKLDWSKQVAHYLLNFGKRTFLAAFISQILDHIDNLWTGIFLGNNALGFYSRAYTFSTYPRKILAAPLNSVTAGTYAELKGQIKKLSQSFFRVNAFLIRSGFFLSGLLVLIAPEFIRIFLGEKWLPMLNVFRLLLIFSMLDPIKVTLSNLFIAIGFPEIVARIRLIQLGIMIIGIFVFGFLWNIEGVAIAVNLMAVIGIALLLLKAKRFVNYSIFQLFTMPSIGLIFGIVISRLAILIPGILGSPWRTGTVKGIVFCLIYSIILVLFERKHLQLVLGMASLLLPKGSKYNP